MPENFLDNPLGSIFDEPDTDVADVDAAASEAPTTAAHDPMRSPLSSGFPWQRERQSGRPIHELPRGPFDPDLPARPEYFICLAGPCRHYREWMEDAGVLGEDLRSELNRVCMGFGLARSMSEGTCFGCTSYAPPLWSPAGLRWRIISAHRLGTFRRMQNGLPPLTPRERVIEWLYARVKGTAAELPRPYPTGEESTANVPVK